jgi:hypothetical protein
VQRHGLWPRIRACYRGKLILGCLKVDRRPEGFEDGNRLAEVPAGPPIGGGTAFCEMLSGEQGAQRGGRFAFRILVPSPGSNAGQSEKILLGAPPISQNRGGLTDDEAACTFDLCLR